MISFKGLVASFALSAVAAGCASVPMATKEADIAAKEFKVAPTGRANVYVYRNESMGAGVTMPVTLDGTPAGANVAKTFLLLFVAPGEHQLVSHAENESALLLKAEEGKNYFVWQEVKMGVLKARTQLHLVDEAVGRAGVAECSLAATAAAAPVAAPAAAP